MSIRCLNHFGAYLDLLIASRYARPRQLLQGLGEPYTHKKSEAIRQWRKGMAFPRVRRYVEIAKKIESHFGLPQGRLTSMIGGARSLLFEGLKTKPHNLQMLRWHLPNDFDDRSDQRKREILQWISANVLSCATDYGKYQSKVASQKFAVVFPTLPRGLGGRKWMGEWVKEPSPYPTTPAPPRLVTEFEGLLAFKTATLPPKGYQRKGRWQTTTAEVQVLRYGLALGLFAADRDGEIKGLGVPLADLTLGLFAFPELWEWYLGWYEKRRGFFSSAEQNILYEIKSHTRDPTGWVRQHPELAQRLKPIPGLVTSADIQWARRNWAAACSRTYEYALQRIAELKPLARTHRDPFEAIMPVLTAKQPLRLYKKIGDEIVRNMPDERQRPVSAAKAVRSYLAFRLAIHLGIRQRNLRELLLCPPGSKPRDVRELEGRRRGEMRWNGKQRTWDVFIPAVAIKNGGSSFFKWRPFQMTLPNRENLYWWIECYLKKHRNVLLNGREDPGTVLVRTMVGTHWKNAEIDIHAFYFQWKDMIQRYGIFNPYTKRGAIPGLLPHGPHCVRDILATHLLKTTGSYELASYAIQDSIEGVIQHYTRFLPHEKVARAAAELNKVWRH